MRPVFFWVEVIEGSATRRACQHPKASGNNCTHGSNGAAVPASSIIRGPAPLIECLARFHHTERPLCTFCSMLRA